MLSQSDIFSNVMPYKVVFAELGISVKPKKGRALVWNNMNEKGECDPVSIHQANKVITGHKYILQRW